MRTRDTMTLKQATDLLWKILQGIENSDTVEEFRGSFTETIPNSPERGASMAHQLEAWLSRDIQPKIIGANKREFPKQIPAVVIACREKFGDQPIGPPK